MFEVCSNYLALAIRRLSISVSVGPAMSQCLRSGVPPLSFIYVNLTMVLSMWAKQVVTRNFKFMAEIAVFVLKLASLAEPNFFGKKYTVFRKIWEAHENRNSHS